MTGHQALVLLHVLLFVYWLGTDLGVFYVNFLVLDRQLSPETRGVLARVLLNLDLAPRICLVLTLPVGFTLAGSLGISPLRGWWLVALWLLAAVWLVAVVTIHREHGSTRGQQLSRVDLWFRVLLVLVLLTLAVWSLVGDGPLTTTWLPLKVALFAVAIACGLGIRLVLRPFGPALGAVVAGSASEGAEADLRSSLRRTYPLVFTIWAAVIAAAALGIARI